MSVPFAHIGHSVKIPSRSRFIDPARIWLGSEIFMEEGVVFDTANLIFNEGPDPIRIRIGNRVTIGRHALISAANRVEIGNNVLFAQNVYVADNDHHYSDIGIPIRDQYFSGYEGYVVIEEDCWLGRNVVVSGASRGVTIGKGAVIGANAVVTFDVPPYAVVVGNPGRIVKLYDPEVDEFVRVSGPEDLQRVMASRARLGIQPRPVRVDLAEFHHLIPPMAIEGAADVTYGTIVTPDSTGWSTWLESHVSAFTAQDPVALVLGIELESDAERVIAQVTEYCERVLPEDSAAVIVQPFEARPCFLRALKSCLVSADDSNAERACLEAMACGVPVAAALRGRVGRWLRDGQTGLGSDDPVALLRRIAGAEDLSKLGRQARTLMERTFGVPPVLVEAPIYYYTPPSDRIGI